MLVITAQTNAPKEHALLYYILIRLSSNYI